MLVPLPETLGERNRYLPVLYFVALVRNSTQVVPFGLVKNDAQWKWIASLMPDGLIVLIGPQVSSPRLCDRSMLNTSRGKKLLSKPSRLTYSMNCGGSVGG